MDAVIEKFYSNGKNPSSKFTQFGAFSNGLVTQNTINNPNSGFKTMCVLNGGTHSGTENILKKSAPMTQQDFLRPKNLVFNSTSDMLFPNVMPPAKGELKVLNENTKVIEKQNATKMQIMEEKMKNLELKSQRLEVINDFFFDMFENGLVREELEKQRRRREKEEQEEEQDNNNNGLYRSGDYSKKYGKRKKEKKFKNDYNSSNINNISTGINTGYNPSSLSSFQTTPQPPPQINPTQIDPKSFQQTIIQNARSALVKVRESVGNFLVEEQLKKNEQIQTLNEDILEMRSALMNKLDRIQLKHRLHFEKIAFCLKNSGDRRIETLAERLLTGDVFKGDEYINDTYDNNSVISKRKSISASKRQSISSIRKGDIGGRSSINSKNMQNNRESLNAIKEEDD